MCLSFTSVRISGSGCATGVAKARSKAEAAAQGCAHAMRGVLEPVEKVSANAQEEDLSPITRRFRSAVTNLHPLTSELNVKGPQP